MSLHNARERDLALRPHLTARDVKSYVREGIRRLRQGRVIDIPLQLGLIDAGSSYITESNRMRSGEAVSGKSSR